MLLLLLAVQGVNQLALALSEESEDHIKAATVWSIGQIGRHTPEHAKAVALANLLPKLLELYMDAGSSEDLQTKVKLPPPVVNSPVALAHKSFSQYHLSFVVILFLPFNPLRHRAFYGIQRRRRAADWSHLPLAVADRRVAGKRKRTQQSREAERLSD